MHDKFIDALRTGKLKGHTRIILEDPVTKRREIHEDSNMMTNALSKIFESNYLGCMSYHSFISMKSLLGGVFLFWNQLTENADNIFPPAQDVNKLSFYAGQTAHSEDNPYRGHLNGTATVIDPANGQIKFVWDWPLEGVGQISAVGLTLSAFGDRGLYSDANKPLEVAYGFEVDGVNRIGETVFGTGFDEAKAVRFPMSLKDNGNGLSMWISGTTFIEKTVRHPWSMPTLIEVPSIGSNDNYTVVSTRTATLSRTFTSGYTLIGQDSDNYYVMERDSSSATTLYVDIISKTDMSVTSQTITITESLARPNVPNVMMFCGIVSNGFIYWPSSSNSNTFVKIDMAIPANTILLTSSMTVDPRLYAQPIVMSDGLVLGQNWLINGDYLYPVQMRRNYGESWETWEEVYPRYKDSPLVYCMPRSRYSSGSRYIVSNGVLVPYLATINNISGGPITKNSNRTMRVEYLITLVGGN